MRDKTFVINAIKMDLYRVVTAAGKSDQNFAETSVKQFLDHAQKDFNKIILDPHEAKLRDELMKLANEIEQIKKSDTERLRWTEKILTLRSRL